MNSFKVFSSVSTIRLHTLQRWIFIFLYLGPSVERCLGKMYLLQSVRLDRLVSAPWILFNFFLLTLNNFNFATVWSLDYTYMYSIVYTIQSVSDKTRLCMEYCAVLCVHINREKKDKCFFFALLSYIIDTTSPPGDREENLFKTGRINIL